ncbi:COF family haloacid dehalogenase(HAD)-like hydrolase [Mycoplasmopsis canis UFG4]|uniref:COF family haloacid dehalogenase(HAD)-like hydrolase n=3 Tax=Mycoplasmopsis TaxID=2767358 RepID=I1A7J9_9BACT|nr:Cof-type HAD-IIB family hydrolase [Mycoplasmopsis canis]AKF40874.1 hydrolase [Mycoplasmopsis canis]AMD80987.1 hydrolase [Mycoplasmopsis canis PG 14]EIE41039.1 COF family haloacid dehalogenase(HAD)-like hydrolase [Mycoplasmopsis canis UF31]EIE41112.1 COF family haloacid dehalogenase(HAD)-like hydrolase [Mycoplasmopsis canis PG 14]EIE41163.1 COF family haloacid dehalogenase(HAD)-like hydrolase [Mycoplasmopsis canis UF33]
MEKERYLFAIDLDGTTLRSSATGEVHDQTIAAIKRAKDEGHVVCILTGRPWRSTKFIYEALGLDTVVSNYNGAHIHHPNDDAFIPYIKYLNLNEALYILGDEKVQKEISNIAIEGPDWVQLQHRDEDLEKVFGFSTTPKLKIGLDFHKIPLMPTGIIFDVKKDTDVEDLRCYLKARYGDLAEFSYWSKGEGLSPVFDMTNITANKGKALSMLIRYYDIKTENTVALGDGFNDVPMFKVANVSVAMGNATKDVKRYATVRISKSNKEGGVGWYINKFLDNPELEIQKSNDKRKKVRQAEEE